MDKFVKLTWRLLNMFSKILFLLIHLSHKKGFDLFIFYTFFLSIINLPVRRLPKSDTKKGQPCLKSVR